MGVILLLLSSLLEPPREVLDRAVTAREAQ